MHEFIFCYKFRVLKAIYKLNLAKIQIIAKSIKKTVEKCDYRRDDLWHFNSIDFSSNLIKNLEESLRNRRGVHFHTPRRREKKALGHSSQFNKGII